MIRPRRARWGAALLSLCLAAQGCNSVSVTTANVANGIPASFTAHGFLWGLVSGDVNTGYEGVARVEVDTGVGAWLGRFFTVGLYWPTNVKVWVSHTYKKGS